MTLLTRVAAYAPNGARRGIVPTPQTLKCSLPFNDVGGLTLDYPAAGPRVDLISGPTELALEVSANDGQTWVEPPDARYLIIERASDPLSDVPVLKYSAPGYAWRLSKARVLPEGKLNADGKRAFLSATAGTILGTLALEAQDRGALAGMDFSTFSSSTDSAGQSWSKIITLYFEPGVDYLTVLLNLATQGVCDFRMEGRSLRVFNPDATLATDAPGVTLQRGADLTEAPYRASLAGLANFLFLAGDEGVTSQRVNPEGARPWGRWEAFISQGGVSDQGTMNSLTDVALADGARERVENTYGLSLAAARKYPLLDYRPGQYLLVRGGTQVPERLRCRQITLVQDEHRNVTGSAVLNDRFLEDEVRRTRRIQGITGGASADGGSGARPVPPGSETEDDVAPGRGTVPEVTSEAYVDSTGNIKARVTLTWAQVQFNEDGSAYDDRGWVRLYWSQDTDGATLVAVPPVDGQRTSAVVEDMPPNTWRRWYTQAVDKTGNSGQISAHRRHLSASDATAPERPSVPVVTSWLGQLVASWDGLNYLGGNPPTDFAQVDVHVSSTSGFTPSRETLAGSIESRYGGKVVISDQGYSATRYVRLIALDRSGNASDPSDQATGTTRRVTEEAIETWAITGPKIADFAVRRAAIEELAVDDSRIANAEIGKLTTGNLTAIMTVSGTIRTASSGARVTLTALGLSLFNTSNVRTGFWDASNGAIDMRGTFRTEANSGRSIVMSASLSGVVGGAANQAGLVFPSSTADIRPSQMYDNQQALLLDSPAYSTTLSDNISRRGSSIAVEARGVFMYVEQQTPATGSDVFQARNDGYVALGRAINGRGRFFAQQNYWEITTSGSTGTIVQGTYDGVWRLGDKNSTGPYVTGSTSSGAWKLGRDGAAGVYCTSTNGSVGLVTNRGGGFISEDNGNTYLYTNTGGPTLDLYASGTWTLGHPNDQSVYSAGTQLVIRGGTGRNGIFLQPKSGTIVYVAGEGMFIAGNLSVQGTKNFLIPHPLDPAKALQHAATESPVAGVEYTGHAVVGPLGDVSVTLPGYFESLTLEAGRTAHLTPTDPTDQHLVATSIERGALVVEGEPGVGFYWLVKATRAGAEFDVEQPRAGSMLPATDGPIEPTPPSQESTP